MGSIPIAVYSYKLEVQEIEEGKAKRQVLRNVGRHSYSSGVILKTDLGVGTAWSGRQFCKLNNSSVRIRISPQELSDCKRKELWLSG